MARHRQIWNPYPQAVKAASVLLAALLLAGCGGAPQHVAGTRSPAGDATVGDALRTVRGVRVHCNQETFECFAVMARTPQCQPTWWIDGVEVHSFHENTPIRDIYGIDSRMLSAIKYERGMIEVAVAAEEPERSHQRRERTATATQRLYPQLTAPVRQGGFFQSLFGGGGYAGANSRPPVPPNRIR